MGEPVLLIAGAPGTGKTLTGKIIAEALECAFIQSSQLMASMGAVRPDPTGRHTLVVDWIKGIDAARRVVASTPSCVVVETLYPSLWIEAVEDSVAAVILLRCHPQELCKRLSRRKWPKAKILENCAAEALGSVASELMDWWHMIIEVDTSNKSPAEAAELALDLLAAWRVGIYIDWLAVDQDLVEDLTRWLSRVDSDKYGLLE